MRKGMRIVLLAVLVTALGLAGCESMYLSEKAQPPVVTLERVEVAHSWVSGIKGKKPEFYINGKERRGSPLVLAFVFNVYNPNKYKVMLDELRFTMAFEGFELMEPTVYEDQWIPPETTNQIRVHATLDAFTTLLSMLVPAGNVERWKKMKVKPAALIKRWWETVGDFAFPIEVRNGVATFQRPDGESIISTFKATFPPKS
jgi:hypothetical protein